MKQLSVDLRSRSAPPRWAWGLVGLIFLLAIGLGLAAYRESRKLEAFKAQRDDLLRQLAEPPKPSPAMAQKMPYDASAREMLALAASEWPAMLTALESVEIIGVTPVALEIAPAERWIRVEVEFADYARLLEYVDGLNAGEPKPKWGLVQAQTNARPSGVSLTSTSIATIRGVW
jgi:hypothetical protein